MKKTNFGAKRTYTVAMSQDTGCLVMVQVEPDNSLKVIGSLTREDSVKLARGIIDFVETPAGEVVKATLRAPKPKLTVVN